VILDSFHCFLRTYFAHCYTDVRREEINDEHHISTDSRSVLLLHILEYITPLFLTAFRNQIIIIGHRQGTVCSQRFSIRVFLQFR
jgi:hypothetical protein